MKKKIFFIQLREILHGKDDIRFNDLARVADSDHTGGMESLNARYNTKYANKCNFYGWESMHTR